MLNDISVESEFGKNVEKQGIAFSKINHPLISNLKYFWRDKGDTLSR